MNTHARLRLWNAGFFLFVGCLFAAVYLLPGCQAKPIDQMDQDQFDLLVGDISATAQLAAYTVIKDHPENAGRVETLAKSLDALASGKIDPGVLKLWASDPVYEVVLQRLLARLENWYATLGMSPRVKELVASAATGLRLGLPPEPKPSK